jgi:CRISPR-associated protein Csx17
VNAPHDQGRMQVVLAAPGAPLEISGAAATSLGGYLKGLGLLRVVSQASPLATAWWRGDRFCLGIGWEDEALCDFLLTRYVPTPILSPWNKDGGMVPGGRRNKWLMEIEASSDQRLAPYRAAIAIAQDIRHRHPEPAGSDAEKSRAKAEFLVALRSSLPEACLEWVDTCWALRRGKAGVDAVASPLAVSGGSDGRLDFSKAYQQAVLLALGIGTESGRSFSLAAVLRSALFAQAPTVRLMDLSPGLFIPGALAGPNSSSGDTSPKLANPWDIVLMMEGLLVWGGSVVRHLRAKSRGRAAFPFTFEASHGGSGVSLADTKTGAEVWAPTWQRPATYAEIRQLFREGRAEWRGRPARGAVDVARAARSLGVQRGISTFERYAIHKRNGTAYLAVALGSYPVRDNPDPKVTALKDLDRWLMQLDRNLGGKGTWPSTIHELRGRVDGHMLAYCRTGRSEHLMPLLWTVADLELALAQRAEVFVRPRTKPSAEEPPEPLMLLNPVLLSDAPDQSMLRLASAFASQRIRRRLDPQDKSADGAEPRQSALTPMRAWVEPVQVDGKRRWQWSREAWQLSTAGIGNQPALPARAFERMLRDADVQSGATSAKTAPWPASASVWASLGELEQYVSREDGPIPLASWIRLATLFDWSQTQGVQAEHPPMGPRPLLVLLKAATQPMPMPLGSDPISREGPWVQISPEPNILTLVRSGEPPQIQRAAALAILRIFAAGFPIPMELQQASWRLSADEHRRLANALAVPVHPLHLRNVLQAMFSDREGRDETRATTIG